MRRRVLLLALPLVPTAHAQRAPDTVPEAWRRYAAQVQRGLEPVLEEEAGEPAVRLRDWLAGRGTAGVTLRLWIDPAGRVTRVDQDAAMPPAVAADLRQLLVARTVGDAPPADLDWPITLRVSAPPPPAPPAAPG